MPPQVNVIEAKGQPVNSSTRDYAMCLVGFAPKSAVAAGMVAPGDLAVGLADFWRFGERRRGRGAKRRG